MFSISHLCLIVLCLFSIPSLALFKIESSVNLSVGEKEYLSQLDKDLEILLPASIKNKIIQNELTIVVKDIATIASNNAPLVAYYNENSLFRRPNKIDFNMFYITKLSQLPEMGKQTLVTEVLKVHDSKYMLTKTIDFFVKSSLILEIGHFYDNNYVRFEPQPQIEQQRIFSDNPQFLNAAGFPEQGFFTEVNSHQRSNFLDILNNNTKKWETPQASFAINLVDYLMNPEFKCRHKGLYDVFAHHFVFYPFNNLKCDSTQHVFISPNTYTKFSPSYFKEIDPARVYAIHYMIAGQGKELMSRYGHAMLRLVICSPSRKEIDEKCLEDLNYHLVINFRGFISDTEISLFDGINGKYPMIEYIAPLNSIIDEYAKNELRWIKSLPLNLEKEERYSLINSILETHWSYLGKYKFFTNNCADETLQLLKRGLPLNKNIQDIRISRPDTLYNQLIEINLGDASQFVNLKKAESLGYYFPSSEKYYEDVLKYLSKFNLIDKNLNLEGYLNLSFESRFSLVYSDRLSGFSKQEKIGIYSSLLTLENLIIKKHDSLKMKQKIKLMLERISAKEVVVKSPVEVNDNSLVKKYFRTLFNSPAYFLIESNQGQAEHDGLPNQTEVEKIIKLVNENHNYKNLLTKDEQFRIESEADSLLDPKLLTQIKLTRENYILIHNQYVQLSEF